MTPIAAYNVDILHHRSAEAYAVTRYELVASHVQIHLMRFLLATLRPVITMTARSEIV